MPLKMGFGIALLSFCALLKSCLSVPSAVVELTDSSIIETINRPDTDLWLIAYYAPWCQHSQHVLPIIDDVATVLDKQGGVSIGTLDCSKHEAFCSDEKINGYPTLKWYRDGVFHDYIGGRDHDGFISFVSEMNRPVLEEIHDHRTIVDTKLSDDKSNDAVFLYYKLGSSEDDNHIDLIQKAARPFQATTSFVHLESNSKNKEWIETLTSSLKRSGDFFFKIERGTNPIFYNTEWSVASLSDFINDNKEVTIAYVDDANFDHYANLKTYLAIAILDTTVDKNEDSNKFLENFRALALSCSPRIRSKFQFIWIDGQQWKKFLRKFSISPKQSPQLFVLEHPYDIFWTDPNRETRSTTSMNDMGTFLTVVLSAKILSTHLSTKFQDTRKFERIMWLTENKWLLNLHLFIMLFAFLLYVPPGSDRIHDLIETYLWKGCIDKMLIHMNLLDYKKED